MERPTKDVIDEYAKDVDDKVKQFEKDKEQALLNKEQVKNRRIRFDVEIEDVRIDIKDKYPEGKVKEPNLIKSGITNIYRCGACARAGPHAQCAVAGRTRCWRAASARAAQGRARWAVRALDFCGGGTRSKEVEGLLGAWDHLHDRRARRSCVDCGLHFTQLLQLQIPTLPRRSPGRRSLAGAPAKSPGRSRDRKTPTNAQAKLLAWARTRPSGARDGGTALALVGVFPLLPPSSLCPRSHSGADARISPKSLRGTGPEQKKPRVAGG